MAISKSPHIPYGFRGNLFEQYTLIFDHILCHYSYEQCHSDNVLTIWTYSGYHCFNYNTWQARTGFEHLWSEINYIYHIGAQKGTRQRQCIGCTRCTVTMGGTSSKNTRDKWEVGFGIFKCFYWEHTQLIHETEQGPPLMGSLHSNKRAEAGPGSRKRLTSENMDTEGRPNNDGFTRAMLQNKEAPQKVKDMPTMENLLGRQR